MVEQEDLEDITKVLSEENLQDKGPVRILVQGTFSRLNFYHGLFKQSENERKRQSKRNFGMKMLFSLKIPLLLCE